MIVVDAVVTGAPVGTVQAWDGRQPLASPSTTASTHGLGVAEAIELARVLGCLPIKLRVYGIEGRHFRDWSGSLTEVKKPSRNGAKHRHGNDTRSSNQMSPGRDQDNTLILRDCVHQNAVEFSMQEDLSLDSSSFAWRGFQSAGQTPYSSRE